MPAGENVGDDEGLAFGFAGDEILQAFREVERRLGGNVGALDQLRRADPADFDAAEQVCFRARHAEQPLRIERRFGAEDFTVRLEADLGAAVVVDLAEFFQAALRLAARERLFVELAAARHFDFEFFGERVHNGNADAVQAAGSFVDF